MVLEFLAMSTMLRQRLQLRRRSYPPRSAPQTLTSTAFQSLLAPGSLKQAVENNTRTLGIK